MFSDVYRQMLFVLSKAIERPESGDFQINTFAAQSARGFLRFVRHGSLTLGLEKGHQVGQFNLFPIREALVLPPHNELVQETGVGALGMFRLAAFVTEVLEKVLNERLHGS